MNNTTNQSETFYGINKDGKYEKLNRLEATTTITMKQTFRCFIRNYGLFRGIYRWIFIGY